MDDNSTDMHTLNCAMYTADTKKPNNAPKATSSCFLYLLKNKSIDLLFICLETYFVKGKQIYVYCKDKPCLL